MSITWIDEARIYGGAIVRVGDVVDLVPAEKMREHPEADSEEELEFNRKHHAFMQDKYLGPGPYTVAHIGRWPCGHVHVYVKTETSSGSGVDCYDLMPFGASTQVIDLEPKVNDKNLMAPLVEPTPPGGYGKCPTCGAELAPFDGGGGVYCPEGCLI